MMKKQFFTISIMLIASLVFAQTKPDVPTKIAGSNDSNNLFVGLGGAYSFYQDVKYSDVQFSGLGGALTIGFNKNREKYFWEIGLNLKAAIESGSTHGKTSTAIHSNIYFKYLKPIKNNIKIGARLDLIDGYLRLNQGLGNNGNYIITGHNLYASVMHNYKINDNWSLQSGLDIGILSFMKESTGFAFSAPQNGLEEGEFDYQNETLSSPFGYKYFIWKYFGNYLNIKTSFDFKYKKRWSIGYNWEMRTFSTIKSYPTTIGTHSIIVKYNIIHK